MRSLEFFAFVGRGCGADDLFFFELDFPGNFFAFVGRRRGFEVLVAFTTDAVLGLAFCWLLARSWHIYFR